MMSTSMNREASFVPRISQERTIRTQRDTAHSSMRFSWLSTARAWHGACVRFRSDGTCIGELSHGEEVPTRSPGRHRLVYHPRLDHSPCLASSTVHDSSIVLAHHPVGAW